MHSCRLSNAVWSARLIYSLFLPLKLVVVTFRVCVVGVRSTSFSREKVFGGITNDSAQIATADGGVIGVSGATYDGNGNATGQVGSLPTQSWTNGTYSSSSTVAALALPAVQWGTSYAAMNGGNPSNNGTFIGVAEQVEGMPVWAISNWGPSCELGSQKVPLAGAALTTYTNERDALIAGHYLTSNRCSALFNNAAAPARARYFSQLTNGVNHQVPFDGPQTNISLEAAGLLDPVGMLDPIKVGIYSKYPVCASFIRPIPYRPSRTTAVSQLTGPGGGPGTDVYINSNPDLLRTLTQGVIIHETLHNLTQLYDPDLEDLLGIPRAHCTYTYCITLTLVTGGCAGPN